MQDADKSRSYMDLADTQPSLLLKGDTPRLIDEWQMAPVLWDAVRFEVDQRQAVGQFILTGSSDPKDGVTAHTGTGRISQMLMRPMSLFESKESDGSVSLKSLFESNLEISSTSTLSIEDIRHLFECLEKNFCYRRSTCMVACNKIENCYKNIFKKAFC